MNKYVLLASMLLATTGELTAQVQKDSLEVFAQTGYGDKGTTYLRNQTDPAILDILSVKYRHYFGNNSFHLGAQTGTVSAQAYNGYQKHLEYAYFQHDFERNFSAYLGQFRSSVGYGSAYNNPSLLANDAAMTNSPYNQLGFKFTKDRKKNIDERHKQGFSLHAGILTDHQGIGEDINPTGMASLTYSRTNYSKEDTVNLMASIGASVNSGPIGDKIAKGSVIICPYFTRSDNGSSVGGYLTFVHNFDGSSTVFAPSGFLETTELKELGDIISGIRLSAEYKLTPIADEKKLLTAFYLRKAFDNGITLKGEVGVQNEGKEVNFKGGMTASFYLGKSVSKGSPKK